MSALAIPTAPVRTTRGGHLQVVRPGFVPASASGETDKARGPVAQAARPAIRLTARGRLTRSLLALTVTLVLAVAVGGWLGGVMAGSQPHAGPVERVSVQTGDTVWAVAAAAAAPGQDVREVVEDILQLNGLTSGDVVVGQQILVPAG